MSSLDEHEINASTNALFRVQFYGFIDDLNSKIERTNEISNGSFQNKIVVVLAAARRRETARTASARARATTRETMRANASQRLMKEQTNEPTNQRTKANE
jgi:hypothetical protein